MLKKLVDSLISVDRKDLWYETRPKPSVDEIVRHPLETNEAQDLMTAYSNNTFLGVNRQSSRESLFFRISVFSPQNLNVSTKSWPHVPIYTFFSATCLDLDLCKLRETNIWFYLIGENSNDIWHAFTHFPNDIWYAFSNLFGLFSLFF